MKETNCQLDEQRMDLDRHMKFAHNAYDPYFSHKMYTDTYGKIVTNVPP